MRLLAVARGLQCWSFHALNHGQYLQHMYCVSHGGAEGKVGNRKSMLEQNLQDVFFLEVAVFSSSRTNAEGLIC